MSGKEAAKPRKEGPQLASLLRENPAGGGQECTQRPEKKLGCHTGNHGKAGEERHFGVLST